MKSCRAWAAGSVGIYCDYAIRYRGYQTEPPVVRFRGPLEAMKGDPARVRFSLSKLSVVEVKIYKGDRLAFTRIGTFRRGSLYFRWRPGTAGRFRVRVGAKELRTGSYLRGRSSGEIMVQRAPGG